MLINSFRMFLSCLHNSSQDHRPKWSIYATDPDGFGVGTWIQGLTFDLCVYPPPQKMYGMSGESLRSVTEKVRGVSHSLQMGIQGRWRVNGYDGGSATKLPVGVLQLVVELITSAKGLFSLLNR